jgi:uncharacterized membrane protein HdeD (DUF308 family)
MILLIHLLVGVVISSKIEYFWVALFLAFLSHYLLDLIPHIEYNIENIKNNQWQKSSPDFLKIILDLSLGLLIIFLLSNNSFKTYACALVSIIPDGLTFLEYLLPNVFLKKHSRFHREIIHILKNKKISNSWRFSTQIIVGVISIYILLF